jgi:hypothetical protein
MSYFGLARGPNKSSPFMQRLFVLKLSFKILAENSLSPIRISGGKSFPALWKSSKSKLAQSEKPAVTSWIEADFTPLASALNEGIKAMLSSFD